MVSVRLFDGLDFLGFAVPAANLNRRPAHDARRDRRACTDPGARLPAEPVEPARDDRHR